MILQNILLLWNSKKILLQIIRSILYNNHHLTISSFLNNCYIINLLITKSAFRKYLGKNNSKSLLLDFFENSYILLIRRITLAEYINNLQDN